MLTAAAVGLAGCATYGAGLARGQGDGPPRLTPRGEAGLIIAGALVEFAAGASLIAYGRAHPEQHNSRRGCWEIDLSSPGDSPCGQSGGNPTVPGFVVSGVGALELAFGIYNFATNQDSSTPRRSR